MCIRLIQWVTYKNNYTHSHASTSHCPAKLCTPSPPPRPSHTPHKNKKGKNKKFWISILCHSVNVHNFTGIASSTPIPSHPTLHQNFFFLDLDFFVKIHLLVSLKLELYDFRSYSSMIIFVLEIWVV